MIVYRWSRTGKMITSKSQTNEYPAHEQCFGYFRGITGPASKVIIVMRTNTNTDMRSIQISKPNGPLEFGGKRKTGTRG